MPVRFDLQRFVDAQVDTFTRAAAELRAGRKDSHWMWYIFPQIAGLGSTETSKHFAIKDINEAMDYLTDPLLGMRLVKICEALLELPENDVHAIFGRPDDLKLKSSMTLFDAVPATFPVFSRVLDKFYGGERDGKTLDTLARQKEKM